MAHRDPERRPRRLGRRRPRGPWPECVAARAILAGAIAADATAAPLTRQAAAVALAEALADADEAPAALAVDCLLALVDVARAAGLA